MGKPSQELVWGGLSFLGAGHFIFFIADSRAWVKACGSALARDEPGAGTYFFFLGFGLVVLAASVMVEVDTSGGKYPLYLASSSKPESE